MATGFMLFFLIPMMFILLWWMYRRGKRDGRIENSVGKRALGAESDNPVSPTGPVLTAAQAALKGHSADGNTVSYSPDGSFKLGGKSSRQVVHDFADKSRRAAQSRPEARTISSLVAGASSEADLQNLHDGGVPEQEFVASLLRQIDENNRDITALSSRLRDADKLREQVSNLKTRLAEKEQNLSQLLNASSIESVHAASAREIDMHLASSLTKEGSNGSRATSGPDPKIPTAHDGELEKLKAELEALRKEQQATQLQLSERIQHIVELETRLDDPVDNPGSVDPQVDKSSPTRTFASGAVASAAARAASRSTDPKPRADKIRQLYQPPDVSDDLKQIKGIGLKMEQMLNQLGVCTFEQLANFNATDIEAVSAELKAFSGRIERDNWIGQAAKLHKHLNKKVETQ